MTRSRCIVVSAAVVLGVGAGCGGDGPTVPPSVAPTVRLTGDSVVSVASQITLSAQGTDSSGKLVVSGQLRWTTSDPVVADVSSIGVVTGRAAGTATVTVSSGYASAARVVTVRDDRPSVPLAVGESVTGRIVAGVATERLVVTVTAGDTLDLLVRMDSANASLYGAHLRSTTADWLKVSVVTPHGIGLYGAVVPSSTGSYPLEAVGDLICESRNCIPPSGRYTVRVRRSGPIFNVPRMYERAFVSLPEGGITRDTVWAQNIGLGTVTVRATTAAPWLRPDPEGVALAGPKPAGITPDVVTPIGATVDTRGLAQGVYEDSLDLDGATGEWSSVRPFGHLVRRIQLRVTDSSARIIPTGAWLRLLSASPDGRLYGVAVDSVVTVDPVTGATSLIVRLPFSASRLAAGADGALYVSRWSVDSGGVFRINGTSLERLLELRNCPAPFAVLPNGTLYAICDTFLYRRMPGRAQERVATFPSTTYPTSIVYRPADDALYIMYGAQLWRYDHAGGELTLRGTVENIGSFNLHAVDAQGRLVGAVPFVLQQVRVHDTSGAVLDRRTLPDVVNGLAIVGSTIVVTSGTRLWRLPVR